MAPASKLQVLGNLPMVYNFVFDVFLFDTHFSAMQYWGIIICSFVFMIDIAMTVQADKAERAKKA